MPDKQYTEQALAEIGRKVIEARQRAWERSRERRKIKDALYAAYRNGEFGDFKV